MKHALGEIGRVENPTALATVREQDRSFGGCGQVTGCDELISRRVVAAAERFREIGVEHHAHDMAEFSRPGQAADGSGQPRPRWDKERGELWLGDKLVKRFTQLAVIQEKILDAFERAIRRKPNSSRIWASVSGRSVNKTTVSSFFLSKKPSVAYA